MILFFPRPLVRIVLAGVLSCGGGIAARAQPAATKTSAPVSSVQGVPNAVQGFSQNRDQPIKIDAASLEVRDKDKIATFTGDVKVVQGDTTMRSKILVVFYEGETTGATAAPGAKAPAAKAATPAVPAKSTMKSATPGPTGSSSIKRLEAKGDVIVTQKDQTVTGESGVFDMKTNIVTMLGNVVLTQGDNVLKGDRLIVDMTTGISRVESNSGRVQGLFKSSATPAQAPGAAGTAPAPAPGSTKLGPAAGPGAAPKR